jgi:hypothetical protein
MLACKTHGSTSCRARGDRNATEGDSVSLDRRDQHPAVRCDQKRQPGRRRWWQLLCRRAGTLGADHLPVRQTAPTDSNVLDCYARPRHAGPKRSFVPQTRGSRADPAAYRRMGDIRRKPGASRRTLAYSCSVRFLSGDGANLDYPVKTARSVDSDRVVACRFPGKEMSGMTNARSSVS